MKAVVQSGYGGVDVLRIVDLAPPAAGDDDVLVRVRAASVHADVWHVLSGMPYVMRLMGSGLKTPKQPIPGSDMAGVVESVGTNVKRFAPGDAVFGETLPGMQWQNGGAFAELVAVHESLVEKKPANVSFERAAAVPASGIIAWNTLVNEGQLASGKNVLINGAGGGVGTLALQLAKGYGAAVTAVDCKEKLPMLTALGADNVWDYTHAPVTEIDDRFDIILDVASNLKLRKCRRILSPNGIYVLVGHDHYGQKGHHVMGSLPRVLGLSALSLFHRHLPKSPFQMPSKPDAMKVLAQFLAEEKITPTIDKIYPLNDVQAAITYLLSEKSQGKIILVP